MAVVNRRKRVRVAMLKTGILNPQIQSLLARVRHTNALVIADRGFPFWPHLETVDISLVDDIPTVLDVLQAVSYRWAGAAEARQHMVPALSSRAWLRHLPDTPIGLRELCLSVAAGPQSGRGMEAIPQQDHNHAGSTRGRTNLRLHC